ncbi:ABC transporter permease [Halobellus litoreus]|uniref:ABC transporter permease n=1 Tax=Halobellus litoreus TaxID=755310 RepID=A0ABD6DTZ2_9EURY|nr:ABC transporter permease [Halobellus litoreus]
MSLSNVLPDGGLRQHPLVRNLREGIALIANDRTTLFYLSFLVFVILLGAIGPEIAPYPYDEPMYAGGEPLLSEPPSVTHPLGTTSSGYDVFSRILVGARPTVITGLLGGTIIITIGSAIGITAGYVGGRTEDVLMRITDIAYGVPLIPFAIVLLALFGVGFLMSVVVIGLLLWRGPARVLRSQVLQIRQRPFILAAKATGASTPRIIYKHILPNVAPMAIMYFALGIGLSILLQAGLAFIGVSNPLVPSWGIMIRNAYTSGQMTTTWWWSISPGIFISLTVMSTIMLGRRYEELVGQTDGEAVATA